MGRGCSSTLGLSILWFSPDSARRFWAVSGGMWAASRADFYQIGKNRGPGRQVAVIGQNMLFCPMLTRPVLRAPGKSVPPLFSLGANIGQYGSPGPGGQGVLDGVEAAEAVCAIGKWNGKMEFWRRASVTGP